MKCENNNNSRLSFNLAPLIASFIIIIANTAINSLLGKKYQRFCVHSIYYFKALATRVKLKYHLAYADDASRRPPPSSTTPSYDVNNTQPLILLRRITKSRSAVNCFFNTHPSFVKNNNDCRH